jgi:hypothetical protein
LLQPSIGAEIILLRISVSVAKALHHLPEAIVSCFLRPNAGQTQVALTGPVKCR